MAEQHAPIDRDLIREFLQATLPFSELDAGALDRLVRHCLIDFQPAGTRIFIRNVTEIDGLLVIQKGGVKLFVQDEAGQITLADFRGEGACVGAMALFQNAKASLSAETVEDTFFVKIPKDAFFEAAGANPAIPRFFLKTLSETFTTKAFTEIRQRRNESSDDSNLYLFSLKVGSLVERAPVTVPFGMSIQDAAQVMIRHSVGSLLIQEQTGKPCGIITDIDIRKSVALGLSMLAPVETIMSAPLETIAETAVCFDALVSMMAKNIHHLAMTSGEEITGVITSHDIMLLQGRSPLAVFREVSTRNTYEGLYPMRAKTCRVARTLVEEGGRAGNITRILSIINDLMLNRLLELLLKELGPPPVKFCWLVMGSEGRREQTFATDQDNALVYADCSVDYLQRAAEVYFEAFTQRAVEHLVRCGFPRCPGDMMASNPKWRKPLSAWKDTFDHWIAAPEPKEVLHSTIFFDFRGGPGDSSLAEELRSHITGRCAANDIFLRHMAVDCVQARPPLSFFNNIVVEKNGEHKNTLDIKTRGLLPFMDFARIMALRHGIRQTSTLERLDQLKAGGHIPNDLAQEAMAAFEFLQQIRLVHQMDMLDRNLEPNNHIDPAQLSALEKRTMRDAFGAVTKLQSHLKEAFRLQMA
ncbi:MAG: CBS domain-containing protein [Proteobacteria bacterium]|nr:CBS domain-containing protein [Pseudomonadota bacterium]MBU1595210.1 CBS domain-containing protein [Pseudomonadota bacterium]